MPQCTRLSEIICCIDVSPILKSIKGDIEKTHAHRLTDLRPMHTVCRDNIEIKLKINVKNRLIEKTHVYDSQL